ncbi:MAG: arsenosugar biosynthesis radical SAM (seleno)protein ArsS [Caldimicrobium sp.]
MVMETAVLETYKRAAKTKEIRLCCPVSYSRPELLKIIPQEILEKDYGCGDPTVYVREGEVVLDLGSGSGKHCYMIAQIVGPKGKVIGVDFNDEMLALARKYQNEIAKKLGYLNTEFRKARIQNLKLDLEKVDSYLLENPIKTFEDLLKFEEFIKYLEEKEPLIPDNSVDTVVSNCVLNLVKDEDKEKLFREIFRVLKPEGRAVISDIVSDEDVPELLKKDPELWAGCISGALREDKFIEAFLKAGFTSVRILKYDEKPCQVIERIEFRSITIEAHKGEKGACIDKGHAVIYTGPFVKVEDSEGHIFELGKRVAVCERTFKNLKRYAYDQFIFVEPAKPLTPRPFPWGEKIIYRSPKVTKNGKWDSVVSGSPCCSPPQEFIPFSQKLREIGITLTKGSVDIIQVNVGSKCNEKCLHCHLSAGPKGGLMSEKVISAILELLKRYPGKILDITGGSPELHPLIKDFISQASMYTKEILFRTNFTALLERDDLITLLAEKKVKIIGSFPSLEEHSADFFRGNGFYKRAFLALKKLNEAGYGRIYSLYLMVNPTDISLAPPENEIKKEFYKFFNEKGLFFTDLYVLNNFPIGRFKRYLKKIGKLDDYYKLLYANFNPETLKKVMCLKLINISPDGSLYDCDFNQALKLSLKETKNIFELLEKGLEALENKPIQIGDHCYACTALYGTSCFGSLT